MARPTRPAHHVLTSDEMACWDPAQEQRSRENGFLWALLLALSPAVVPLVVYVLFSWGWL